MTERGEASPEIVARLGAICLRLPEGYEEPAWVGTRWRVRKRTYAHVLTVESGWPPAYARAVGSDGPVTLMTFESSGQELDALAHVGHPFFRPVWRATVVGVVLDADTDWREITELVTESYRAVAPRKLVSLLDLP